MTYRLYANMVPPQGQDLAKIKALRHRESALSEPAHTSNPKFERKKQKKENKERQMERTVEKTKRNHRLHAESHHNLSSATNTDMDCIASPP